MNFKFKFNLTSYESGPGGKILGRIGGKEYEISEQPSLKFASAKQSLIRIKLKLKYPTATTEDSTCG